MRSPVWPARQVIFCVFRSEKRVPNRRSVSFCVLCAGRDNQYLVECEVREIARSVAYTVKPVENDTVLAALEFLSAVPVCTFCLLLILHAAFKSYKMLSVQKLCQSRS
jgi:hypothetical protein